MFKNLEQLIKTIRERKNYSPEQSYTNKLLNDKNLSVSKVKEEIGELIEAVEENSNKIHEAADVIYHLMVYLESNNIKIEDQRIFTFKSIQVSRICCRVKVKNLLY